MGFALTMFFYLLFDPSSEGFFISPDWTLIFEQT